MSLLLLWNASAAVPAPVSSGAVGGRRKRIQERRKREWQVVEELARDLLYDPVAEANEELVMTLLLEEHL